MAQLIKTINFDELVKNSNNTLSLNLQTKMVDLLNDEFTEQEQQWYIANLYVYMNYHPTNDFPINLEHVFKMIGFANKGNAMKTIKSNFVLNEDYKVALFHTEKRKNEGGFNKEEIMLNVDTFKNLCMIAKTEKGKEIRKYYVKLENIYNKIIKEEIQDKQLLLDEKDQQLQIKDQQLQTKDKLLQDLENKPETEGFYRESGEIYCIKDTTKPGHLKIGIANKSITRVDQLNVGSSTHSLELYMKFETFDRLLAEKLIHHSLNPFRIKNRKEWFYFKNDLEIAYAINTIKKSLEYIKIFNIKNYTHFKESTLNLDTNAELINPEITKKLQIEHNKKIKAHVDKIKKTNRNNIQQSSHKTGTFKGVCWVNEKQLWKAELQNNYKNNFLGYFQNEIDGAKTYNDYALYLNENENSNFLLNDIPGYITIARNVPEQNSIESQGKKTSKYNGVSYDSRRKYYVSSIKLAGKSYNLGSSQNEIDCAKLYNQQALFFNNDTTLRTKYILNEIENYVTLPKDIRSELIQNKQNKKSSKYYGVSLNKINKWVCSYMLNRKKIHIGTFDTELEACQAYNEIVIELNKNGCNYKVN